MKTRKHNRIQTAPKQRPSEC